MVLEKLKKGESGKEKDESYEKDDMAAKKSACDDVMEALKDGDSEAFEKSLKSVIKQVLAESEE